MKFLGCPTCGYVRGATTGYDPLTDKERAELESLGYILSHDVFGDDVAGFPKNPVCTARAVYHEVICRIPPRFEREVLPERKRR